MYGQYKKFFHMTDKNFKKFILMESQTGSGKTYSAMLHALKFAKDKKCVVLSFHTKNWVD